MTRIAALLCVTIAAAFDGLPHGLSAFRGARCHYFVGAPETAAATLTECHALCIEMGCTEFSHQARRPSLGALQAATCELNVGPLCRLAGNASWTHYVPDGSHVETDALTSQRFLSRSLVIQGARLRSHSHALGTHSLGRTHSTPSPALCCLQA